MKNALLTFFTFLSISSFAQFSKTHYIPPLTAQNNLAEDQYVYISTPSNTDVSVKIIEIGGNTITRVVTNSNPVIHPIGQGNNSQLFIPKASTGKISNKGYIIEADDLIYTSVRVNAGENPSGSYNHAGGLVSKGNSALGTEFRLGAMLNPLFDTSLLNFASILATENGTTITISNIPPGTILSNGTFFNGPLNVILNKNESYVLALENTDNTVPSNSSKIIGALVTADKPVVVNSGSFGGSNSANLVPNQNGNLVPSGRDVGFDQIVPFDKTGTEYIFVKGAGTDELERVILIAHKPNTIINLNGISAPYATLANEGDYVAIDGSQFSTNGSLYVSSSNKVFAYQCIGGNSTVYSPPANQNMFFVPPLNCATPNTVDNIPYIEQIGNINYTDGSLNIVTEAGATILINGDPVTSLPITIDGKSTFERYSIPISTGNIAVISSKQVYVSFYSSNGAATYGGYYSGFDTKPEITFSSITSTTTGCMPNVELSITSDPLNNRFQWVYNGQDIPGAISNTYTPSLSEKGPGYYKVKKFIISCGTETPSDEIPVSDCPIDTDNDGINNNIDIDNDNDGITNCTESYGDKAIPVSSPSGSVAIGNYSNSYIGSPTISGSGTNTFTGSSGDSFTTNLAAGITNAVTYKLDFNNPISVGLKYNPSTTATASSLSNEEFVIKSDTNKTITVLNPSNQLLIDTNYDGIYESGVIVYSSFEIRFRLNSTILLPTSGSAPTVDFKFQTYLSKSISFTHKNLSDSDTNNASFSFFAVCVPRDSDGDGITDDLDADSDNDGIPDSIEAQGNNLITLFTDANHDGLYDAFGANGLTPKDTDNDGVADYLDLDSDNDGIYDLVEDGSNAIDANSDGIIDGNPASFGSNGLYDSVETFIDSGILKYSITDTDGNGIANYRDLDSDNDLCSDVFEAGFTDPDGDKLLGGTVSPTVDANGVVTSGIGYTTPNQNYIIAAPIVITTQPDAPPTCESENVNISITDNGDSYQWQLSTNGTTWTDISNTATYSNATTNTMTITSVSNAMNDFKYRVKLNKIGNSCGLDSDPTTLIVNPLPIVNVTTIIQCDDDSDLKTFFNLTLKNNVISNNFINENFTYYTSQAEANNPLSIVPISTPLAFENINPPLPAPQGIMYVWVRVADKITGCFRIAKLTLKVASSQFPLGYSFKVPPVCDDTLAADGSSTAELNTNKRDGITSFDLTNAIADVEAKLPLPLSDHNIKYYRNRNDALVQNDTFGNSLAINPTEYKNFRNDIPNVQNIWVRVNNNLTNDCGFGFGDFIKLSVEKLPFANPVTIPRQCDDNQDGVYTFNTAALQSTLLNGQTDVTVTYFDSSNNPLPSPFPATFATPSQTIKAVVTNNSTLKCYDETLIVFTVDDLPEAFSIPTSLTTVCDDEPKPLLQNGQFAFDTSTFEATILNGQTGMIVKYFDKNGNSLPSPLPNPFVTVTQNIKVTIENTINTTCTASLIIPFIVNPLPNISLNTNGNEDALICDDNPKFSVELDAGIQDGTSITNYAYAWNKVGVSPSIGTNYTLLVFEEGIYSVKVTNSWGCSRIRTIKVTASNIATIQTIDIADMTDINTVTVNVTGSGNYEYSLNDSYGPFQSSNFFDNVPAGIHEVYVNDKNGCGIVSQRIAILGAPKFFTPNGDGYNDYWNLKGANKDFNSKSIIFIFDRYGKLLKKINPSDEGWDGTFNGLTLPADDYWFTIELEDGRAAKGHFSLKR